MKLKKAVARELLLSASREYLVHLVGKREADDWLRRYRPSAFHRRPVGRARPVPVRPGKHAAILARAAARHARRLTSSRAKPAEGAPKKPWDRKRWKKRRIRKTSPRQVLPHTPGTI